MALSFIQWFWGGAALSATALGVGVASDVISNDALKKGVVEVQRLAALSPQPATETPAKPAETLEVDPQEKAPAPPVEASTPSGPAFDILRVEKDGSVLIAGRAVPNAQVEVLDGAGTIIGSVKAGPGGDFVVLPEQFLKPGDHVLSLRATAADGKPQLSAEAGIIHIPATSDGEVLAMVSKDGAASRILVKPETLKAPSVAKVPVVKEEPKVAELEKVEEPVTEVAVAPEPKVEPDVAPTPTVVTTPAPEPIPATATPQVLVEAVEVDSGRIYVAGAAKPGAKVQVYVNNEPVGITRGTLDNRFLLTEKYDLKPGRHSVRADVISAGSGKVTARAEVPLLHQPLAAKPETEVAQVQVAANNQNAQPADDSVASSSDDQTVDPIRTGSSIIIRPGDNLWRISRRTYGEGVRYTTIYNANRDQIRDPNRIYVGQIFKLPEKATN